MTFIVHSTESSNNQALWQGQVRSGHNEKETFTYTHLCRKLTTEYMTQTLTKGLLHKPISLLRKYIFIDKIHFWKLCSELMAPEHLKHKKG